MVDKLTKYTSYPTIITTACLHQWYYLAWDDERQLARRSRNLHLACSPYEWMGSCCLATGLGRFYPSPECIDTMTMMTGWILSNRKPQTIICLWTSFICLMFLSFDLFSYLVLLIFMFHFIHVESFYPFYVSNSLFQNFFAIYSLWPFH
jgi:hypothetical protein